MIFDLKNFLNCTWASCLFAKAPDIVYSTLECSILTLPRQAYHIGINFYD